MALTHRYIVPGAALPLQEDEFGVGRRRDIVWELDHAVLTVTPAAWSWNATVEWLLLEPVVTVTPQRWTWDIDWLLQAPVLEITPTDQLYISTGAEPVALWTAPNRQCEPRVRARNVIVMQPNERIRLGFDMTGALENQDAYISQVVSVTDESNGFVESDWVINNPIVSFFVDVPEGASDRDIEVECTILDSNGNQIVVDGLLRIREH